jgi:hypothetical protein
MERFVLGPDQDWSRFVMTTTKDLALSAVALPGEIRRFLSSAQRGNLEIGFKNVDSAAKLMYTLGHQLIYAAVGIGAVFLAVLFEGRGELEHARVCWWIAGGAGAVLLLSFWTTRSWLKRRRR